MSDPSYPDRDSIIAAVMAEMQFGGRPLLAFYALGGDTNLPPIDADALLAKVHVDNEARLLYLETLSTGI